MGNVVQPMWADCPALTRAICVGYPALSLAMMALSAVPVGETSLDVLLFDTSLMSVSRMHVWALFIGCFYSPMLAGGMQFLMALITIYMMMMYLPRRERQIGSTAHLLWMMCINCLANLLRLLVMLVMVYVVQKPMYWIFPSNGMWPVIVADLTINLLGDPDGSTSFWGFVTLPNKWYPIALVAFFCMLSGMTPLWDMIAACALGYAYMHFKLERYMPSPARAAKIERLSCCRQGRFSLLGACWIPAMSTPGFGEDPADRRYAGMSDFGRTSGQQLTAPGSGGGGGGSSAFTAFSGAGNTLGDGGGDRQMQPLQSPQRREEGPGGVPAEPGDGV